MSRTVTVLYDSRAEAEVARERLVTALKAQQTRIIGKDTLGAIDSVGIERKHAFTLRQALRHGAQVVIAEVPSGTSPNKVLDVLGVSGNVISPADRPTPVSPLRYGIDGDMPYPNVPARASSSYEERLEEVRQVPSEPEDRQQDAEEVPAFVANSSGASSTPERREGSHYGVFSEAEAEAAGLFQERTIDFAEMREEAVVTKEAIVREEVIVTKTIKERSETIRDTVRHTTFEVEQL